MGNLYGERVRTELARLKRDDPAGFADALMAITALRRRMTDPLQVAELPGSESLRRFVHRARTRVVVIEFKELDGGDATLLNLLVLP